MSLIWKRPPPCGSHLCVVSACRLSSAGHPVTACRALCSHPDLSHCDSCRQNRYFILILTGGCATGLREGVGEEERERSIGWLPPVPTPTRDGTCNLLVQGWRSNPLARLVRALPFINHLPCGSSGNLLLEAVTRPSSASQDVYTFTQL